MGPSPPRQRKSLAVIVMGVQGSGKTTVGRAIAQLLGRPFVDADDLHPAANVEKMKQGEALDDSDRRPWLVRVVEAIDQLGAIESLPVVACSALKRQYRDLLRTSNADVLFLHLQASEHVISERVTGRSHQFMHPALLGSQFSALESLEPDELGFVLNADQSVDRLIDEALAVIYESIDDG